MDVVLSTTMVDADAEARLGWVPGQWAGAIAAMRSDEDDLEQRAYVPGKPLCFLHVPKTGGTSVRTIMENAFDGRRVYPSGSKARGEYHFPEVGIAAGDDMRSFLALSGHHGPSIEKYIDPDANMFTWLRDPMERLESDFFFFFVQQGARNRNPFERRISSGERIETVFMDWFEKQPVSATAQYELLVTGRKRRSLWLSENPGADVSAIAAATLHRCFFVGMLEDHERSIDAFCAITSILPPSQHEKRNRGSRRLQLDLSPEERGEIRARLVADFEFYETARTLYRRQMERLAAAAEGNAVLRLIGDREGLRRHILADAATRVASPAARWDAWDAVFGDNLHDREIATSKDAPERRWRWTGPGEETSLLFRPPQRDGFRVTFELFPATPAANIAAATLEVAGHPIRLRHEAAHGSVRVVGEVPGRIVQQNPGYLEFKLRTPVMLDEGKITPYAGTRMLGLAIESISFAPPTRPFMGWLRSWR